MSSPAQNEPPSQETASKAKKSPGLSILSRILFALSGLLLIVGFFLPWVTAGTALELSGLGLVFSGGEVVNAISGSGRFLLFFVPLLGAALILGAVLGQRTTSWVAALGAGFLLLFGLIHVIRLFISSTGLGMWLVVVASLFILTLGLLSISSRNR